MIQKLDHIGIAVKSIADEIPWYRDILGFHLLSIEEVESQQVRVALFAVGDIRIELLEPTSSGSPIARFIEKKGPGMHHIGYEVDDMEKTIAHLEKNSVRMIDSSARPGSHNMQIAFVHPQSAHGILTELCSLGRH